MTARVIPVILRPVDWSGGLFARLQMLPKDGKPVTQWADRDAAFVDVAKGIRLVVEAMAGESEVIPPSQAEEQASARDPSSLSNAGTKAEDERKKAAREQTCKRIEQQGRRT